ncbi:hypothetical protein FVE85_6164 [Porphyridium purpureum]|uniref:Uncharacterized protein n=1 Tax=Porphyridium purpureum TaxID=35688 RepID=A0A5J4Z3M7_PORPP|nr:hypothetical protein FVE85_6164 [Porphyridium purpureum]|eukprot:POR1174..scf295_1
MECAAFVGIGAGCWVRGAQPGEQLRCAGLRIDGRRVGISPPAGRPWRSSLHVRVQAAPESDRSAGAVERATSPEEQALEQLLEGVLKQQRIVVLGTDEGTFTGKREVDANTKTGRETLRDRETLKRALKLAEALENREVSLASGGAGKKKNVKNAKNAKNAKNVKTSAVPVGGAGVKVTKYKLVGVWDLLVCQSDALKKNKGLTGLGKLLPFSVLESVTQTLNGDGSAESAETVAYSAGFAKVTNKLIGTFSVRDGNTLEQTYEKALIRGVHEMRSDSKAVLRVSFLNGRIRICRAGTRDDLYIFLKR